MDTLRQQKRRQTEMRLLAGPAWSNPNNLVFTDEFGKHLNHDLVYRHLKRLFIKMGLPKLRFTTSAIAMQCSPSRRETI